MTHHHNHSHHSNLSINKILIISILLNLLFVITETGIGLIENSLSLLSDAGHNFSDIFSLILVVIAFKLAKVKSNDKFTYGYKKSTILISLINAIILFVTVGVIITESIHKFQSKDMINGIAISWTAGAGIIVNGLTALLLMRNQKNDLNIRGAILHMLADTLVSTGVVISGIIITYTEIYIIDPIVSIIIAIIILLSTRNLLSSSLRLTLDGTPENLSINEVSLSIKKVCHVKDVHHIHIWAISTTENALTAHIVIDDISKMNETKHLLKELLCSLNISHSTLEFEISPSTCDSTFCN